MDEVGWDPPPDPPTLLDTLPAAEEPALTQRAAAGMTWSTIEAWGARLLSMLVFVLLARLLLPEAFGIIALASVFVVLMEHLRDQGFSEAIVQRRNLDPAHLDSAFWFGVALAAAVGLVLWGAARPVSALLNEPELSNILPWLGLSIVVTGLGSTQAALLRRELRFRELATRSLWAQAIGGVAAIGAAAMGAGVWALVIHVLLTNLAGSLLLWILSEWHPHMRFSKNHFHDLFSFGINVLGLRLAHFASRHADDFLIGIFLGPVALGYYSVAYRVLLLLVRLGPQTLASVVVPVFSRVQTDLERVRWGFGSALRMGSLVGFPVFGALLIVAPYLVEVVFGSRWAQAVPVLQALALVGIVQSLDVFNAHLLIAVGRPEWAFRLAMIHSAANVFVFSLAVQWGIVAVALAYSLRAYALYPITLHILKRTIQVRPATYLSEISRPAIATLVMISAGESFSRLAGMHMKPLLALLLVTFVASFIYFGMMLLIGRGLLREAWGYGRMMTRRLEESK